MITPQQAWAIGHLVHELRPAWEAEGVVAQVKRVADRNPVMVALACIRAAADPDAKTPGVIPTNGTHWNEGIKQAPNEWHPPKREQECTLHAGQYAGSCNGCRADQLAGDRTLPPELRRPDASNHAQRARAEVRAATARCCSHGIDRARGKCAQCERETTTPTETEEIQP